MKDSLEKIKAALGEMSSKLQVHEKKKERALACSVSMGESAKAELEVKMEEEDDSVSEEDLKSLAEYLNYRIDSVNRELERLYTRFWEHAGNGHLPPIVGAEQMTKALEALGLAGDYKVEKKTIYATDGMVSSVSWEVKK